LECTESSHHAGAAEDRVMGLSNVAVKKANKNNVYRFLLANGTVSKNDIARELGLTVPTIASALNELLDAGLAKADGTLESRGGRKSVGYTCVPQARYAIGVNITRKYLDFAVVDLTMHPVYQHHQKFEIHDNEESYQQLKYMISDVILESRVNQNDILGIAYAIPAITDGTGTRIFGMHEELDLSWSFYNISKNWFPFPSMLRREALCSAFAAINRMSLTGTTVYMNIAPSVGGALIYNGSHVSLGMNCRTGEIGHITLVPGGKPCYCGRKGCVNAYCSTDNLTSYTNGDLHAFFELLDQGDTRCRALWETYTDYLSITVHNLMTAFDHKIVIGGPIAEFLEPHLDEVREKVEKTDPYLKGMNYLRCCGMHDSEAIGAAGIYIERFLKSV